jgi:hypothetical protein
VGGGFLRSNWLVDVLRGLRRGVHRCTAGTWTVKSEQARLHCVQANFASFNCASRQILLLAV